jgi:hypothetical protein
MEGAMRKLIRLAVLFLLAVPAFSARPHPSRPRTARASTSHRKNPAKCIGCARDSRGRIKRSRSARAAFKKANPCPATGRTSGPCPRYVIDHVKALKRGGADAPANMQWQTKEQAKAKDRVE